MEKLALCLALLLASRGGALARAEGALSEGQPAAAPTDSTGFPEPEGPLLVTAPAQATTPAAQLRGPTPGGAKPSAAPPPPPPTSREPTDYSSIIIFICVFIIFSYVVGFYAFYTKTRPLSRTYSGPYRQDADISSSEDDDASLSSNSGEGREDALSIRGLPSANPVVKFRRARPGKPDEREVASPPENLLDMLFSSLNDQ